MHVKLTTGVPVEFKEIEISRHGMGIYSISEDTLYAMKVQLVSDDEKKHSIYGEAEIIKMLNARNCRTCVEFVDLFEISGEQLAENYGHKLKNAGNFDPSKVYPMMVTRAYPAMTPVYSQDLVMAIIEQKKLGVWQGDVKPDDTLVEYATKCIKLIDYDQAILLDDEKIEMGNEAFFDWVDQDAAERFAEFDVDSFLINFDQNDRAITREEFVDPFMDGDRFNIGATLLFNSQETTLDENKIYHSFLTPDIYAVGERTLEDRIENLDKLDFEPGERVLDVGCNAGLLCQYLYDRGCKVSGIDIDPSVIEGAQIMANIVGKPEIDFRCVDVDKGGLIGHFDTVFLFSVIHHTRHLERNAQMIARMCNRLVIECRCNERGAKPVGDGWEETSVWNHDTVEDLIVGLETLFPGFRQQRTIGQGDRDRYMFELKKHD